MTLTDQGTVPTADYDGTEPFPAGSPEARAGGLRLHAALTGLFVALPFAGLAVAVWMLWGHGIGLADVLLALGFYAFTGLGVTVGFHRLLTHRSFTAGPWLRTTLAVAGSMSFQGNVIDWVAVHRRHHAFTDRPGDAHSPYRYGTGLTGRLRGLAHDASRHVTAAGGTLRLHDPPAMLTRLFTLTGADALLAAPVPQRLPQDLVARAASAPAVLSGAL